MKFSQSVRFLTLFIVACTALIVLRCGTVQELGFNPLGEMKDPTDNPTNADKIWLGKEFFFDKRLSLDETVSCAVCHKPGLAFTDGLMVSEGIKGRLGNRNSPTLINIGFSERFMFDGEIPTLEMQAIVPIQEHKEMGMDMKALIERLRAVPEYQEAARRIFNRDMDVWVLTRSLAAYQRSLYSNNSDFDRFYYGKQKNAISASAKRGWILFSEKLYCTACHPAPFFTTHTVANNGLYADYGEDKGRFRIKNDSTDIGKFKIPTLRNIQITDPYMHDGSMESLSEVIDHYAKGGKGHVNQHPVIQSFELTKREKSDLIQFLYSLTDMSFMERL